METGSEPVEQIDREFDRSSDISEPPVAQRTSSRVSKPPDYYGVRIYTAGDADSCAWLLTTWFWYLFVGGSVYESCRVSIGLEHFVQV